MARSREPTTSGVRAPTEAEIDGSAVVQDERGVQHPHQLGEAELTPMQVQVQDGGELVASESADGGEPLRGRPQHGVPPRAQRCR
jgi:hypothetical protein